MALSVSLPGPNFTQINISGFNTPFNQQLAQDISSFLTSLVPVDPVLNVQTYTPPTTPAAIASDVNELVVPASLNGGTVFTPAGYTFVVDDTGGGSFTVAGAQNFIGGSGNLTVYDAVGAASVGGGVDTITAGDGNDLFGLIPGSTYTVAGGNGDDTYYANGSGAIADGTGSNLIFVDSAGGTNLVLSYGTSDTIVAGAGAATISTNGTDPLIFGGSGSLELFGNSATDVTFFGGTGPEVLFGATSGTYFLGTSTSLFFGGPASDSTIIGTTGSETVFGGPSSNEVIFTNSSSLVFVAGTSNSSTIVGGSSPTTLFGGSAGSDITYLSSSSTGGALYFAGPGNETLNAAGSISTAAGSIANATLFGGQDPTGGDLLVGGAGNNSLIAGSGSDTMTGGKGDNTFAFFKGSAGGDDFITDYGVEGSKDTVDLQGYGANAISSALLSATVAGGATTIALPDNTKITFDHVTSVSSINIHSS